MSTFLKTYVVDISAFGRISTRRFEAADEEDAREQALRRAGFSIVVSPAAPGTAHRPRIDLRTAIRGSR
jgi:hypothetical protein